MKIKFNYHEDQKNYTWDAMLIRISNVSLKNFIYGNMYQSKI